MEEQLQDSLENHDEVIDGGNKRPKFSIPAWARNKYVVTATAFVLWVAFFDDHNLLYSIHLSREVGKRVARRESLTQQIEQTRKEQEELLGTPDALEKFAREKYLFKKDNEDEFIIKEKE